MIMSHFPKFGLFVTNIRLFTMNCGFHFLDLNPDYSKPDASYLFLQNALLKLGLMQLLLVLPKNVIINLVLMNVLRMRTALLLGFLRTDIGHFVVVKINLLGLETALYNRLQPYLIMSIIINKVESAETTLGNTNLAVNSHGSAPEDLVGVVSWRTTKTSRFKVIIFFVVMKLRLLHFISDRVERLRRFSRMEAIVSASPVLGDMDLGGCLEVVLVVLKNRDVKEECSPRLTLPPL